MMLVVDAAIVAAVGEYRETREVGKDLRAVRGIVRLEHDLRDFLRILLVADIDDARHGEQRHVARASRLPAGEKESAAAALVDVDDVRLAVDLHRYRVLRSAAVLEQELAYELDLRVRQARLQIARIEDYRAVLGRRRGVLSCRH